MHSAHVRVSGYGSNLVDAAGSTGLRLDLRVICYFAYVIVWFEAMSVVRRIINNISRRFVLMLGYFSTLILKRSYKGELWSLIMSYYAALASVRRSPCVILVMCVTDA